MMSKADEHGGELSRLFRFEELERGPRTVTVTASEAECTALAERFGVAAISDLTATLVLRKTAAGVYSAAGEIEAAVTVVPETDDEAMEFTVGDSFEEVFANDAGWASLEAASDDGEVDAELVTDGAADMGEIVAQNLSLALDPVFLQAGAMEDGDVVYSAGEAEGDARDNPFAALEALRGRGAPDEDT